LKRIPVLWFGFLHTSHSVEVGHPIMCINPTTFGLVLDLVGVVLLWRFGIPQSVSRSGRQNFVSSEVDQQEVAKAKIYDLISHFGILLIVLGVVSQIAGSHLGSVSAVREDTPSPDPQSIPIDNTKPKTTPIPEP
jgi:hypothetical protein